MARTSTFSQDPHSEPSEVPLSNHKMFQLLLKINNTHQLALEESATVRPSINDNTALKHQFRFYILQGGLLRKS